MITAAKYLFSTSTMPKGKKRNAHLAVARSKRSYESTQPVVSTSSQAATVLDSTDESPLPSSSASAPTAAMLLSDQPLLANSDSDSDFDPENKLKKDPAALLKEFIDDWIASLAREDLFSLSLLLFHILTEDFQLLLGASSKIIGRHVNKHHKTVQKWRIDFLNNQGQLPEYLRGCYHRRNAIAQNEELSEVATQHVRENAFKKGAPNMTARSFCTWVNDELLPSSNLEPGAPRKIGVEVSRNWLHSMGFNVKRITKGLYYDGHEREDVIEDRKTFLNDMCQNGFLLPSNAPNEEAKELVKDVELKTNWENTIFWFHDESTFNANDDEVTMWKDDTMQVIKPKGRGAGLMVSDFIEERDGYLALSDSMHTTLSQGNPTLKQSARVIFEYGKNKEGYWTSEDLMKQMETAVAVAEAKYPSRIFNHVWIFDHSCGHTAYAPDALVVSRLGKKPGGKQPAMRDTTWAGKTQRLVMDDGTPKGAALILEERGINTQTLKLADMKIVLSFHEDFRDERSALHNLVEGRGHMVMFLPKFHCELNGIERVWGHAKRYTRAHCDYRFDSLRRTVPEALNSISCETIANYIRRSRSYMFSYLKGSQPGKEMEKEVQKFGKEYKSHRRVFEKD